MTNGNSHVPCVFSMYIWCKKMRVGGSYLAAFSGISFGAFRPRRSGVQVRSVTRTLSVVAQTGKRFPRFFSMNRRYVRYYRRTATEGCLPRATLTYLLRSKDRTCLTSVAHPIGGGVAVCLRVRRRLRRVVCAGFLKCIPRKRRTRLVAGVSSDYLCCRFLRFVSRGVCSIRPIVMDAPDCRFRPVTSIRGRFLSLFRRLGRGVERRRSGG